MNGQLDVGLVRPRNRHSSETFIDAHAEGLSARTIPLGRRLPWSPYLLRGKLREIRPNIVLAEYGTIAARTAALCRELEIPVVAHFHGFDAFRRDICEEYGADYRSLFESCRALIVVSKAMATRLAALGAPREKIFVIPCGADCVFFDGKDVRRSSSTFLMVSRFVEKKGHSFVLEAFTEIAHRYPEARLDLVGDGPLLRACQTQALRLGISSAVRFFGERGREFVRNRMRTARGFIQASVIAENGDCEGTPVSLLEAGAMGLPVIGTRHGGIVDVIEDGADGLLVEERDISRLSRGMERLLLDDGLSKELGTALQRKVRSTYSLEQSLSALRRVLHEACS